MRVPQNISAFVLLLLCSLGGVWFHFSAEPAVIRGAKAVSGGLDLPTGFYLALQLGSALCFLPLALLGVWLLSRRFQALQTQVAFAIYGVAMAVAYLTYGALLVTPLLAHGLYL
jgi:uncharacterized membrane protein